MQCVQWVINDRPNSLSDHLQEAELAWQNERSLRELFVKGLDTDQIHLNEE